MLRVKMIDLYYFTTLARFNIPYNYQPSWDIKVFGDPEEINATNDVNIG
jgi:hypothetical protein